ncbi:MAG: phosphoribosylformylglycinamidine synthase subunit PurL [Candidatus Kapabacteria bacterium]|nr:phosphoribosylformylglycinamidine synthase subunit PurL [Candidatus Kapabacteria bacterium]
MIEKLNLYSEVEVTLQTAIDLGLTELEFNKILEIMGRTPTYTELGVYSVMWSEHCSYKNSILQLKTLPRSGGRLLVDAGEENAGLIDIGDDYAIAFKIESHNHPSAIEPFQGAATGVGGILRDIFTMGARPIAALNSLRFGNLDSERTKFLMSGVVNGISHYGNCFGVPTVGGEIYFDDCYQDNPLVNAMAVGIVKKDKTASAASEGVGNPVFIIGSSTGRDGIHGASLLASREFDEKTDDMRPTVQVGDPFTEKLLLEATLELIDSGVIAGIQDMGAAGICCSTTEMSAKNGLGMEINLDLVPLREQDMSAYEIMLSESQERMLAVIKIGMEDKARLIAEKWDVSFNQIGIVTDTGIVNLFRNGNQVGSLNADSLVLGGSAPVNIREFIEPKYLQETRKFNINSLKTDLTQEEIFWKLITSPTIASKKWIFEQYDSQVRTNTVSIKGDAAVLRLKETPGKGIAVTTDCNSRYVYLNPYEGAKSAVFEAARNVVCVGAEPVGITNCLNFGNPYDPEVYWQFKEAIRGMGEACRALGTPVTGGNVSFHNQSKNHAIYPTPTIGMLGLIDDINLIMSLDFKEVGDSIYVIGNKRNELGGSEYLKVIHNLISGEAPILDIEEELKLQKLLLNLIRSKSISSAHDISEGGLAITLAEKAISSKNNLGCIINLEGDLKDINIFSESQSRVVISLNPDKEDNLIKMCDLFNVEFYKVGEVSLDSFIIKNLVNTNVSYLKDKYENAIPLIMNNLIKS